MMASFAVLLISHFAYIDATLFFKSTFCSSCLNLGLPSRNNAILMCMLYQLILHQFITYWLKLSLCHTNFQLSLEFSYINHKIINSSLLVLIDKLPIQYYQSFSIYLLVSPKISYRWVLTHKLEAHYSQLFNMSFLCFIFCIYICS